MGTYAVDGPEVARGAGGEGAKDEGDDGQRRHDKDPEEVDPEGDLGQHVGQLEADEDVAAGVKSEDQGDERDEGEQGDDDCRGLR